jgi:hypothetical protein
MLVLDSAQAIGPMGATHPVVEHQCRQSLSRGWQLSRPGITIARARSANPVSADSVCAHPTAGENMPPATPKPLAVFEENIADAEALLKFADGLLTQRQQRVRKERRERIGRALGMNQAARDQLDGAESDHLFVVLKPDSPFTREDFTEPALSPLLRQAVVAVSAAIETWVADRASEFVSEALRTRPDRLARVPLDLKAILELDEKYERRTWGYRQVLIGHIEGMASPASGQIGQVFALVGQPIKWPAVDNHRGLEKGQSERDLDEIYRRRNQIAHAADRSGRTRRTITADEVRGYVSKARSVIEALEGHLTAGE